jgi:hypothetical protein
LIDMQAHFWIKARLFFEGEVHNADL